MDVLLLYPADKKAYRASNSRTVYSQRLNGVPLDPAKWDPLSWTVVSKRAKDGVRIDRGGSRFPLILFSHAAQSQPINYAPTLERIASHGFVIAAPWHEGDTRDDRTIDQINALAKKTLLTCFDGLAHTCLDPVNKAVQNGVLDFRAIIDNIGDLSDFGDRVDLEHVGVLGQSRGSVRALASVGGSTTWGIDPVRWGTDNRRRIDAMMILAIGAASNVSNISVDKITVPSLLVAGKLDANTPLPISVKAFKDIPAGTDKGLVVLTRATHVAYSSQVCAQTQIQGAILDPGGLGFPNPRAIGERLNFEGTIMSEVNGIPLDYCTYDYFVDPVDITPIVKTYTKIQVTTDNVPRTLDTDNAMRIVTELATTFFDATLVKTERADVHFTQYTSPHFLFLKEGDEVSFAESDSFQGRPSECDDPDMPSYNLECD